MKPLWFLTGLGLLVAISGLTCPQTPGDKNQVRERVASLRGFGSPEELRAYLVQQAEAVTQSRSTGGGLFDAFGAMPLAAPTAGAMEGGAASNTSGTADASGSTSFSTTNIQEAGVDESDIVKNDGQYIYALRGKTIHIVKGAPPDALAELATVQLDEQGDSLYLHAGRLVALSQTGYYYPVDFGGGVATGLAVAPSTPVASPTAADTAVSSSPVISAGPQTTVTIINISDPAQPVTEATLKFQGSFANSRMIDNLLYLVLTTTPTLPGNPTPLALEAMPLENWIPNYTLKTADGSTQSGEIAAWQDFYRPEDPQGYAITSVITLNVDAPTTPFKTTAVSANAGVIYASTKALYVTDTNYDFSANAYRTDTEVHKFAFSTDGTVYVGSGLVPGRLLNQYSLGEYQDNLRVATTVDQVVTTPQSSGNVNLGAVSSVSAVTNNNVYVLGEAGGSLSILGKIEGIAPGEQIYAARFLGKRGFLVTFRRVDPLFTLDLTDPANPKIAGQLKVPGYSDYIQLLDDNHLLTIGKDAQDAGSFAWVQGIQLSIFDVTDPTNPTQLYKQVIGGRGSYSEANSNPKAFNYFPAANALAFPADVTTVANGGAGYGQHEFTGLYVYRVTLESGFQLLGRIASVSGMSPQGCYYDYTDFTRGVFIGDDVYSVTGRGVKASPLDAVGTIVGQVTFADAPSLAQNCFYAVQPVVLPVGTGLQ